MYCYRKGSENAERVKQYGGEGYRNVHAGIVMGHLGVARPAVQASVMSIATHGQPFRKSSRLWQGQRRAEELVLERLREAPGNSDVV